MKDVGPNYIDYWQKVCAAQRGLTSSFGIRVQDGCCLAVTSINGGQPNTFGKRYQIPVQLEILPTYLRMIIDNHALSYPHSDIMDVLTGRKSFQDALAAPRKREVRPATDKPGTSVLRNAS